MTNSEWTSADLPSFEGKTVVVTGASRGLGLVTARELARVGARVVLAVRDVRRGAEVATTITGDTEVRALDLADLTSVRRFAGDWDGSLDILVNNAGVMVAPEGRTRDGFETQIGTNHLGHFLLTNLLLPHITDRVVSLSSLAHYRGTINFDDLNWELRSYDPLAAYGQSKLASLLFSLELQRRFDETGSPVRALSAHPGWAATNPQIGSNPMSQDAEAGARTILFAASKDLPGNSYVGPDGYNEMRGYPTRVGRSAEAGNLVVAKKLWSVSERLTGVSFPDGALLPQQAGTSPTR